MTSNVSKYTDFQMLQLLPTEPVLDIRSKSSIGKYDTTLLCAKSKVAPFLNMNTESVLNETKLML